MALYDYTGALRQGRKQYQAAVAKGEYPYLPVLDEILANTDIAMEVSLGVIDIPLARIVGTKTQGRTQAFASNFMPLLAEKTEFGSKWAYLYDYQVSEGVDDPIIAYEFMNRYYVQEGNKRVSVLKYLGAYSIAASVIRLIPKKSDSQDIILYYEFLDFYQVSFNCDVWFTKEGSYKRLLEAMKKEPDQIWSEDERSYFKSAHDRFSKAFSAGRKEDVELTASDAFLLYVEIYGYEFVKKRTEEQMRQDLTKIWDELLLQSRGSQIDLVDAPQEKESSSKLLDWLIPTEHIEPEMLKVAFLYPKDKNSSSWVYSHELGRMYLEQCFAGKMRTVAFDQINTEEDVRNAIDLAVEAKCNVIFTTAPQMASQSIKAAVEHPEIRIFNCSINISYSSICSYYVRAYEVKFLLGALAAAMSESDKIGYIADYPIYGRMANINAFALGARMVNPRATIHLKWSGLEKGNAKGELKEEGINYISGEDIINPSHPSREYGLYHKKKDGTVENLATPICDWGKFYEKIIDSICKGENGTRQARGKKAINYWWGMSSEVVDVIYSTDLPRYTKRLIRFLKASIGSGAFQPFDGEIEAQNGVIVGKDDRSLTPDEIVKMDWLAGNIVGEVPPSSEFREEAQPMILIQGVSLQKDNKEVEE